MTMAERLRASQSTSGPIDPYDLQRHRLSLLHRDGAAVGPTAYRTQLRTLLPVLTSLMTFLPRFCSARWCLASSAPSSNATDREVIKGCDGIRLRPETHPAGPKSRVAVFKEQLAVE